MKFSLVLLVLISMSLFAITSCTQSNTASAPKMSMHDNMTMHDNMKMESSMNEENMADMGRLMKRMGNALEKHKMTNEQHSECARFVNRLNSIMMSCANDVELKAVDKHKEEIEEITKEWNYFERGNFEDH